MNIKICGVKTLDVANAVIEAGASHIGFIFFDRSPRNIALEKATDIAKHISGKINIVAVTVNVSDEFLQEINAAIKPQYFQVHGSESPERCAEIATKTGARIIKAISVSSAEDLKLAEDFQFSTDHILFDAKPPKDSKLPGGNATSFDWGILENFHPQYSWILSGGLNPSNISQAIKTTGATFIDVSSGVESSSGVKDISLIKSFIQNASKDFVGF